MKQSLVGFFIIVLSTVSLPAHAAASPPIEVSGTIPVIGLLERTETDVGGNCILNLLLLLEFTGDDALIVGMAETRFRIVIKGPCDELQGPGTVDETRL